MTADRKTGAVSSEVAGFREAGEYEAAGGDAGHGRLPDYLLGQRYRGCFRSPDGLEADQGDARHRLLHDGRGDGQPLILVTYPPGNRGEPGLRAGR